MTDEETSKKVNAEGTPRAQDENGAERDAAGRSDAEKHPRPQASFTLLVTGIASQIVVSLGEAESPITKKIERDLNQAKYSIDMLQVLEEKTKGNLTEAEEKFLEGVLYDMRMRYIRVCG